MDLTKHHDCQGYGVYDYAPMGQFPSLPGLPSPTALVAVDGGLRITPSQYRQVAIQLLNGTSLANKQESPVAIQGRATLVINQLGSGWASDLVSKGYAVMLLIDSIASGRPYVMATKDPEAASIMADAITGKYVIVGALPTVLEAAKRSLRNRKFQQPPPGVEDCPPDMIKTSQGCQRIAKAGTPEWLVPAVVGVGVITVAAFFLAKKRR